MYSHELLGRWFLDMGGAWVQASQTDGKGLTGVTFSISWNDDVPSLFVVPKGVNEISLMYNGEAAGKLLQPKE